MGHRCGMIRPHSVPALDPRGAAVASRLRRIKRVIIGITAAIALGTWSLVSTAASSAAKVAPSTAPTTATAPADEGFFGQGSPQLGTRTNLTPVLRSQGS